MQGLLTLLGVLLVIASNDAASLFRGAQHLTMSGHVVFPSGPSATLPRNAVFTVALQDVSKADAPAKSIAKATGKANKFPVPYKIEYTTEQCGQGVQFSLTAIIKSKAGKLLYTNSVAVYVVPYGASRTKTKDVPVIYVNGK